MKAEDRKQIEKITGQMKCQKEFQCVDESFENLCRVRDFGDARYLECLERKTPPCTFALVHDYGFEETRFCKCPVRVYLAKNLKK